MSSARVGDPAPDFTLSGTGGRDYTLSSYRGRSVLLVFYPGDATPVCSAQLASYADDIGRFAELDAEVLALSPQDVESKDRWEERRGSPFPFPLLADAGSEVGKAYGIVGPLGFYRRSVFLIDPDGTICWVHRALSGLKYRPVSDLVDAIRACRPASR